MDHVGASILDLPRELLDRVWSYLDWDRRIHQVPVLPDLFQLSLTCHHIRQSVVPLLFRNVALVLHWRGDAMVLPAIYRLRRSRPDLARHIRCVHIVIRSQYEIDAGRRELFVIPANVTNWQDPAEESWYDGQHEQMLVGNHRDRLDKTVKELFDLWHGRENVDASTMTAESMLRLIMTDTARPSSSGKAESEYSVDAADATSGHPRQLKRHVDALATALLCIPPTVRELIFEAKPQGMQDYAPISIGLRVLCAAFKLFSDRIEILTIDAEYQLCDSTPDGRLATLPDKISEPVIRHLCNLKRLTISSSAATSPNRWHPHPSTLSSSATTSPHPIGWYHKLPTLTYDSFVHWHSASASLETLHLCTMRISIRQDNLYQDFMNFIAGFTNLRHLWLYRMKIGPVAKGIFRGLVDNEDKQSLWLRLLIDVRNAHRELDVQASHLCYRINLREDNYVLSESCVRWILTQAIPIGAEIDHYRAQRLITDFVSFLPLWEAEDGDRGRAAAQDKGRASLVDAAMSSRAGWFSN